MLEIRERRLWIHGKPTLLLAGEVHYFWLDRAHWADRIVKAKSCGCNVVASYIPWLVHEPVEGALDLVRRTRPENHLGSFIDLCTAYGLKFLARPGPDTVLESESPLDVAGATVNREGPRWTLTPTNDSNKVVVTTT